MEWETTIACLNDKNIAFPLIDSFSDHSYVMMNAAYDSSDIYEFIFDNTQCSPVIDSNRMREIVDSRLSHSRREGIKIRRDEASRYSLKWEIERTFAIPEDILGCEYIWYVRNRDYEVSIGVKIVAYNITILMNPLYQRPKRQIIDVFF